MEWEIALSLDFWHMKVPDPVRKTQGPNDITSYLRAKSTSKMTFFRFLQNQFQSNLWHPNAIWRCLGPQTVPGSILNHFKTILNNFLKIEFGTFGKPILTSALFKRSENAQNKHFWGIFFQKIRFPVGC